MISFYSFLIVSVLTLNISIKLLFYIVLLYYIVFFYFFFFFSSRRRHTRLQGDWSSDVCSSDLLIFTFFVEMVFCHIAQAGLELLGSQSVGITGMSHHAWSCLFSSC